MLAIVDGENFFFNPFDGLSVGLISARKNSGK
jgi:hypothetical protein